MQLYTRDNLPLSENRASVYRSNEDIKKKGIKNRATGYTAVVLNGILRSSNNPYALYLERVTLSVFCGLGGTNMSVLSARNTEA